MKTLDEVIFEAPYTLTPWEADALFYLKEYRKLDSLDAVAFPEDDNPPLSWDELKTMEGKPVWYEHEFWKGWIILGEVEQGVNCEMIPDQEERWYIVKDGRAKAYRKERMNEMC